MSLMPKNVISHREAQGRSLRYAGKVLRQGLAADLQDNSNACGSVISVAQHLSLRRRTTEDTVVDHFPGTWFLQGEKLAR